MKQFYRLLPLLAVLNFAGCASPDYRIGKNPELFASFPPEVQELVRKGQVNIGFTPPMVSMALGEPDRKYTRLTEAGSLEVWSYTSTQTRTDRQRVMADVRYYDERGRSRTGSDWIWVDVNHETEYERIRIEFNNGAVSAVDTLQP